MGDRDIETRTGMGMRGSVGKAEVGAGASRYVTIGFTSHKRGAVKAMP